MVRLVFVLKPHLRHWPSVQVIPTIPAPPRALTGLSRRLTVAKETVQNGRSAMSNNYEAKFAFGALVLALYLAPPALAQAQSQAGAQPQPQSQSQPAAKPTGQSQTANSTEPQMQSQEAPPPDSLGEAARKARAQKAKATGAKVYTEDKIAGLSGHGVSVVGDGNEGSGGSSDASNSYAAPGANGSSEAGGAAPGGRNEEQYWRQKARQIHDAMSQIDDRIAKIQEEIQKYGAVSIDPSSGYRQNVIYVEDRNAQIKQLEAQKEKLQGQLEALEDEGRKAGADSGWFR